MISLTENQHCEPISQICQDNIQDGILFTIYGWCVYLTVYGQERSDVWNWCLTQRKDRMALWSSILSVKRLLTSNQFIKQINELLCVCVYVSKGTFVFINLMTPVTHIIWKVRGQVKGVVGDEVRSCQGQRSHSSRLNSWYALYIILLYHFLVFCSLFPLQVYLWTYFFYCFI